MTLSPPVITLFEAFGAGAELVGPRLAGGLSVPWFEQAFSTADLEAADPKGSGRLNVQQFIVSSALTDIGSVDLIEAPAARIARAQAVQVKELVRGGGVILGRNATVILADRPNTLHVKLDASPAFRVGRVAERDGIAADQADLRRRREDRGRAELSLETWHWDPRLTDHFDLVVNTETFGIDRTVELIVDAFRQAAG